MCWYFVFVFVLFSLFSSLFSMPFDFRSRLVSGCHFIYLRIKPFNASVLPRDITQDPWDVLPGKYLEGFFFWFVAVVV